MRIEERIIILVIAISVVFITGSVIYFAAKVMRINRPYLWSFTNGLVITLMSTSLAIIFYQSSIGPLIPFIAGQLLGIYLIKRRYVTNNEVAFWIWLPNAISWIGICAFLQSTGYLDKILRLSHYI